MTDTDPLTLTDAAIAEVRTLLENRGLETGHGGLRISIEPGGCAGLMYRFELAASSEPGDVVSDHGEIEVFVDSASVPYVAGSRLDLEETAHGTGFTIDNPNAVEQCGCGISFLRRAPDP